LRAGLIVQENKIAPQKKPNFTYEQSLMDRSPPRQITDSKLTKVQNLQTTMPETFGNTSVYQN
jgi:hypothetical protein